MVPSRSGRYGNTAQTPNSPLIVTLTRKARKAAREADKTAGTKALAREFALSQLYQRASKASKSEGTNAAS